MRMVRVEEEGKGGKRGGRDVRESTIWFNTSLEKRFQIVNMP
jgi:hypothetical protein